MIILTIILVLLIIAATLVFLLYTINARVVFSYDMSDMKMNASLFWLYPLFKAELTANNAKPVLQMYLFQKRIYQTDMENAKHKENKSKMNKIELIRSAAVSNVDVEVSYGFFSPFATGIVCGTLDILTQYVAIDTFNQRPDFTADDGHLAIDASAELNVGRTLQNLMSAYRQNGAQKLSFGTGRGE